MLFTSNSIKQFIESFFNMGKYENGNTDRILVSVYKNPTSDEIRKYIPDSARGYIDNDGNLYLEGYEDLNDIDAVWESPADGRRYGVTVQRLYDTKEVYIGESVGPDLWGDDDDVRYAEMLFEVAKEKNPTFTFFLGDIDTAESESGKESRRGNLAHHNLKVTADMEESLAVKFVKKYIG